MGSPSGLTADAFMAICSSLTQSTPWLYLQNADPLSTLPLILMILSVPTAFAIYKQAHTDSSLSQAQSESSRIHALKSQESLAEQDSLASRSELIPSSVDTSTSELVHPAPGSPFLTEEQHLERTSSNAWDKYNGNIERLNPMTPPASPLLQKQWSPRLNRGFSDSTQTDNGIHNSTAQVHIYCTHVEQKVGKNGLVSSITRPSFHVPVAHFPQLQTTLSASAERAFFHSQQEISVSPILRDPRCLDIQYRLSSSTNPQGPGEVSFDEIITMIRKNKKMNQDTTIYVHVVRLKEIVPCVILTYTYHGQQNRSAVSSVSTYFVDEIAHSTKIIDFRAHLIRVKHLFPNTILWDCARHIVKSVKHDHGMILQTRDLFVEIHGQDQGIGGMQHFKMNSPESVKGFIRDTLPGLLLKNENVVQLQVSAYKKT